MTDSKRAVALSKFQTTYRTISLNERLYLVVFLLSATASFLLKISHNTIS